MKRIRDLSDDELSRLAGRAAALPDAPDALVRAAIELFEARPSPSIAQIARSAANRLLATLAFDSWAQAPTALGVRGVRSATRQLLFSAMGRDIDLRVTPSQQRYSLIGQVLGPDRCGSVELTGGADAAFARVASLDDLGEFRLDDLPAGTYTLALRVADATIELPPIDVGGESA